MPKGNARRPEEDEELLEQLNEAANGSAKENGVVKNPGGNQRRPEAHSNRVQRRERARRTVSTYDYLIGKFAMLFGLALVAGLWYLGALFTIVWLGDRGINLEQLGPFAWLLPIGVTAFEFGVLRSGARSPIVMGLWICVVLFDVGTTALGLQSTIQGNTVASFTFGWDLNSLAICLAGGAIIALVPEPAARALVKELIS